MRHAGNDAGDVGQCGGVVLHGARHAGNDAGAAGQGGSVVLHACENGGNDVGVAREGGSAVVHGAGHAGDDAGVARQYVMARNTLMTTLMQVRQFYAVGQCTTALDTLAKTQVQY